MRAAAKAIALAAIWVVAFVVAIVLHLDLAPARRAIAKQVNRVLAGALAGTVTIERIDRLSWRGVDGVKVQALDPDGTAALLADGVHARVDTARLVRSALGSGPIDVDVREVAIDAVDVRLDADRDGALAIVRAFTPRATSPSTEPSRGVRLAIADVTIAHAWAHGVPGAGVPLVDADADALRGALLIAPGQIAIEVHRASLGARAVPPTATTAQGVVAARVQLPSKSGAGLGARVEWRGPIAGIATTIDAQIDGDRVDATLDAPLLAPEALRTLWPGSPIARAASFHAEAHGALPTLDVDVRTTLGDASVDVRGPITLASETRAKLHVDARAVDAKAIATGAPTSRLDGAGDVTVTRHADGAIAMTSGVDFAGGPLGGKRVPAARIDAALDRDPSGAIHGEATIVSRDRSLPARVVARATPKGKSLAITFDAKASAPRLDGIAWLGPIAKGSAQLTASGTLDLDRGAIAMHADAAADDLDRDGTTVSHATLALDARGPLRAPSIDATVHADHVAFAGAEIDDVHFEAHGPPTRAHLSIALRGGNLPEVDAETDAAITGATALHDVRAQVRHAGEQLDARVDEVKLGAGTALIEDAEVRGLGTPLHLTMESTRDELRVQTRAHDLELARVARLLGQETRVRDGKLAIEADVAIRRTGAEGHVAIDLSHASFDRLEGADAKLDATLSGRHLSGTLHAQLGDAGAIDLTTAGLEFGGDAPILKSWRRAWGRVVIEGRVAIAKVTALLPAGALPFDATGDLILRGRAWRDSPTDDTLGLSLDARTAGLVLVGPAKEPGAPPPWALDGVDLALDSRVDGDTGFAEFALRADDARGELAQVALKADTIPFSKLIGSADERVAALRAIAFNGQILVPSRELSTFPSILSIPGAEGHVALKLDVHGPLDHVEADGTASFDHARLASAGIAIPLDFEVASHYDGERATMQLLAKSRDREVLQARGTLDAKMSDLLDARGAAIPWRSSARAHLATFPLESVGGLSDRQIKGQVTGELALQGLHHDARAGIILDLKALQIGDVTFPEGVVRVSLDDDALDLSVHLVQDDGVVDFTAHAGSHWKAELAPSLDPQAPLHATLKAKGLRAAALLPAVEGAFAELDGRIDADAAIALDPRTRTAQLSGTVGLRDGRFELASVGGEFHDATATLHFTPDGIVTLENARAYGMSGRIEAAASARIDSRGLASASARAVIPKSSALLLSVEGAQVGTIDGNVDVTAIATSDRRELDVTVSVPTFHLQLPLQSERDVQVLGPITGVRIGRAQAGGGFVAVDLDPAKAATARSAEATRVVVTIDLGHDVTVKRGGSLSAQLEGKPTITIAQDVKVTGQIRIPNGTIDVQGKPFDIEKGTITFLDDPTNPQVVLTASWTAEDGTKVYAEFASRLKTPQVTLRSEPPLSKTEILSLLLFGSADTTGGAGQSNQQGNALAGAAGGAAAQPVNRALEQFGLGGVSTRVDTSQGNPRPEVEIPIARNISMQLAVVLGVIPPGTNPDTTLLTVDWRFARAWSLATTVGNAGTSIFDVLWHYRY